MGKTAPPRTTTASLVMAEASLNQRIVASFLVSMSTEVTVRIAGH